MNTNPDPTTPGISRRAVTSAMAWSVPVIAVAVATPLAAASTTPQITGPDDFSAAVGDSVPLVFQVAEAGGAAATGVLTVVLDGTDTVLFDPDADGYSSPTVASVEISDGTALAIVIVQQAGAITGVATFGGTSASFATGLVIEG